MPTTEAGKRLLVWLDDADTDQIIVETVESTLDAIEAEAFAAGDRQGWDAGIAAERARIRDAVDKMPGASPSNVCVFRSAVIAVITD